MVRIIPSDIRCSVIGGLDDHGVRYALNQAETLGNLRSTTLWSLTDEEAKDWVDRNT